MNKQIAGLFTDESVPGPETEMVREYYAMHLDWDSRAEGKTFFMENLGLIQAISSLDELSAYLSSAAFLKASSHPSKEKAFRNFPESPDHRQTSGKTGVCFCCPKGEKNENAEHIYSQNMKTET